MITLSGITTASKEFPLKIEFAIDSRDVPKSTLVSLFPKNANSPIVDTLSGISTFFRLLLLKDEGPISLIPSSNSINIRLFP